MQLGQRSRREQVPLTPRRQDEMRKLSLEGLEEGRKPEGKAIVVRDGKTERIQNAGSEFERIPGAASVGGKWRQKSKG